MTGVSPSEYLDLTQNHVRKDVAATILRDIDAYAQKTYNDGFRAHLGASVIGDDCARKVWYGFRWAVYPAHSGRELRLFNRGHREEARFIEYILGIGGRVWDKDPITGKQYRVEGLVGGHFGGSQDSVIGLPERYKLPPELLFLGEYKTKGTGSGFAKLKEKGVMLTNPQHYDQMCTYGKNRGFHYCIYFSVNKNDDDLWIEVVPLDWNRADEVLRKATYIVTTNQPPPKISFDPTFYKCRMCEFHGPCHKDTPLAVNCRSCINSYATADASWTCRLYGMIPSEIIPKGCQTWTSINSPPGSSSR
jgi:hypothetical protein